jgi:hypothetical protein
MAHGLAMEFLDQVDDEDIAPFACRAGQHAIEVQGIASRISGTTGPAKSVRL